MTTLPSPMQTRAIVRAGDTGGADVPHLDRAAVDALIAAAIANGGRHGERDGLLIALLFDGGLRIVEVVGRSQREADAMTREVTARLAKKPGRPRKIHYEARAGITVNSIVREPEGYALEVIGKGNKPARVGLSQSLVTRLFKYAMDNGIGRAEPLFPISRYRAFQIVSAAFKAAGITKPPRVGTVHVLRHSGGIDLLEQTGNPKMVQDQLRHSDPRMTIRYMKTVSAKHSRQQRQRLDNGW